MKYPKRLFDLETAPDVLAAEEFHCEVCGRKATLEGQKTPTRTLRSLCWCGTVFEVISVA